MRERVDEGPESVNCDVVVVGAGPVGLALAGDLGRRGRSCIVVDEGDGSVVQPKMDLVGIRTMEFCRRWGLVRDVELSDYPRDYPQDNVYLTSLAGYELGRQPMPSMAEDVPPPESPQKRERCPQNLFDPILQRFARAQPGVRLHYGHRFLEFSQDAAGVGAVVCELSTGRRRIVRGAYLVGCDGGRSAVREQLGIAMQGRGVLTYTTNFVFRCADFNALHGKRPGYRYMFVGPDGVWATIVAINGRDQWRMSIIGDASARVRHSDDELERCAHRAMGRPFALEILSVLRWTRSELIAERYGSGRVFLCGDACHLTSPTGGLGMNTGIGDAVDLSWKLDAALSAWGGPRLLASYEVERKPVAKRITEFSTGNLQLMKDVPTSARLGDDSDEGMRARAATGKALMDGLRREWFSQNMHLGNRYVGSPVCVYDEPEDAARNRAEFLDAVHYRPTSRVGCRAPHAWLADGRSTLDLFGDGFVLMAFGTTFDVERFADEAERLGVPLQVASVDEAKVAALYERAFVLVRPDGHVAWRGDALPDARHLLETITGRTRTTIDETLPI